MDYTSETEGETVETTDEVKEDIKEGNSTNTQTPGSELDKIEVTLGDDIFSNAGDPSKELTVSKDKKEDSDKVTTTEIVENNVTRDLLAALNGWTVTSNGESVTINVDSDGNVSYVNADGDVVKDFQVNLVKDEKGNYSIQATKVTTTITVGKEETTSNKGDNKLGEASEVVWDESGYELIDTIKNEDGSTTEKYIKKGTADRTDTNMWTEVTTRVDGVKVVTQTAIVDATLTNGDYTVKAAWGDIEDRNENNDDIIITVLGPSQKVIQIALDNRENVKKDAEKHIIIASVFAGQDAANLAAASNGANTSTIKLTGPFLQSTVHIKDAGTNGGGVGAWLRRMEDGKGGYFYVYCAQHGKGTENTNYDIVNVDEQGYLYRENANHIQYVVEKGWWGTDAGVGSLNAVKSLVSEESKKEIDEGIALAVTQAAIWYYSSAGHDGNKTIPDKDVFTKAWSNGRGDGFKDLTSAQQKAAMELFNALIQKDKTNEQMAGMVNNTTDLIHEDDISSTSVQVVEKVKVENVQELTELVKESLRKEDQEDPTKMGKITPQLDTNKEYYKTNVAVTLAVVPSKLNSDDLVVYIYSGDTLVGSKRVTKDTLEKDNGKVTIENVVLENGANVRFHLNGTQKLTEGAYLFRSDVNCEKSQTMVGYIKGSTQNNKVDLDVNMSFNVSEQLASASGKVEVKGTTKEYDETHTITRDKSSTTEVTENHESIVTVTTTVTERETYDQKINISSVRWQDSNSRTYDPNEGDDDADADSDADTDSDADADTDDDGGTYTPSGGGSDDGVPRTTTRIVRQTEIPDGPVPLATILDDNVPLASIPDDPVPLVSIFDEEVPLAAVPRTGDDSGIWYVVTLLSVMGLAWLSIVGKKKQEES